jgi:hypothetical protein
VYTLQDFSMEAFMGALPEYLEGPGKDKEVQLRRSSLP